MEFVAFVAGLGVRHGQSMVHRQAGGDDEMYHEKWQSRKASNTIRLTYDFFIPNPQRKKIEKKSIFPTSPTCPAKKRMQKKSRSIPQKTPQANLPLKHTHTRPPTQPLKPPRSPPSSLKNAPYPPHLVNPPQFSSAGVGRIPFTA